MAENNEDLIAYSDDEDTNVKVKKGDDKARKYGYI